MPHVASRDVEEVSVLVYDEMGRIRSSVVPFDKAKTLVDVGRAYWVCETLIVVEQDRRAFRRQVYMRDNFTCHYCGTFLGSEEI